MGIEKRRAKARLGNILLILPLAILGALAILLAWGLRAQNDDLPSALIGRQAPEFQLPPIGARQVGFSSSDLRGEASLVNVWASWCVPCRAEMPLLMELSQEGTVPIYGINLKDDHTEALAFLDELGDPFERVGADQSGRVSIDWGVYGVPETFVVDAEGRIVYKHVGPLDRQSLNDEVLPLVRRLQAENTGAASP